MERLAGACLGDRAARAEHEIGEIVQGPYGNGSGGG
jgi:hypothetical protein